MEELKSGQIVKITKDVTGEFIGYYGQLIKETDDGDWEIDFTYNMIRFSGNKAGAYFASKEFTVIPQ